MSRDFPAPVSYWRLAESRRSFEGDWPLARLERLRSLLASEEGKVAFSSTFGIDELGYAFADVSVKARLILQCQRTLEPFGFPVERVVRLGLIAREEDAVALPEGYEPLLAGDEPSSLMDLIEDELILALPLIAKKPDAAPASKYEVGPAPEPVESPFAALEALKIRTKNSH